MRGLLLREVLPLLFIVMIPLSVHAGFFSSLFFGMGKDAEPDAVPAFDQSDNAQLVSLLKAATHIDPNPAKGGGDVIVDNGALAAQPVSDDKLENSKTANGEISLYTVREGDTLSQIADMFDVSPNTILWANDIKKASLIRPGDELVILPITGVSHEVMEGDTISTIADKYDGNIEEILAYNQLASANQISVGDTVVVPGGEVAAPAPAPTRSAPTPVRTSGAVATGGGSSGYAHPLPGAQRTQGLHGYNGVDLAAAPGTPIRAAAAGTVIVSKGAGWNGGYGLYVVIKHDNGTQTLYAHNSSNAVAAGQRVSAGQTVGYVGSSGRSTGSHLHFEVRGARNPF